MLISLFFSYLNYRQIGILHILQSIQKQSLPIILYSFLLLPFIFLSYTFDFYLLIKEITSLSKNKVFYFIAPVLIKRELIFHRFKKIMETFEAKGLNTKSYFSKYMLVSKWIIPLTITTLMEGVESYEYNKMLKANIFIFSPSKKSFFINRAQKIALSVIVILFILRFFVHG